MIRTFPKQPHTFLKIECGVEDDESFEVRSSPSITIVKRQLFKKPVRFFARAILHDTAGSRSLQTTIDDENISAPSKHRTSVLFSQRTKDYIKRIDCAPKYLPFPRNIATTHLTPHHVHALNPHLPPKALLTDVFGTVVNWRLTVTTALTTCASATLNAPTGSLPSTLRATASTIDWGAFAQKWRESYYHFCQTHDPAKSNTGPGGYKTIDQHHRESLEEMLAQFDLTGLWPPSELDELAMIWHFLTPWPDSSRGLALLNQRFITTTLSNGNVSLLADLASTGSLPYTHLLSSEMFKAYKPNPLVYNGAAEKLGLKTSECALMAAHLGDLAAARKCGYRTIYIERVREEGYSADRIESAREWVDLWVDGTQQSGEDGFVEVARRFGIVDGSEDKAVEQQGGERGKKS